MPVRAEPDPERPRYALHLDVRPAAGVVVGDLTVRFSPDLDTDRLLFRLWPNEPSQRARGGSLTTGAMVVDGAPAHATSPDPTTLVVAGRFAAHRAVTVTMPWSLRVPGPANDRLAKVGDVLRLGSFFPILPWERGVGWDDDPPVSGFAEASSAPTADFDVSVALPPGYGALATGAYDGHGHWRATAVRDFALSVGRFRVVSGVAHAPDRVDVTVGVAEGLRDDPAAYLAKAVRVLEDFGRRFGPYPWSTYTLALTPGLRGGIEYPAHVMQGPGTIGHSTSHELGHQWFFALVGDDQGRDPWLDEGLASWAEARFEGTLPGFVARTIPPEARGRLGEPMTFWSQRFAVYYRGVYVQAVQALASLGDPALVDCALRVYVARNAYRIARPADLVAALASVFPDARARLAAYGVRS